MQLPAYLPVLVQVILAVGIGLFIIGVSHLFGQRGRRNRIKDTAYECGMPSGTRTHARFSVKFHLVAMLFILFDIEIVFLVPWALVFREFLAVGIPVLLPGLFFIGVLGVGLLYEYRKRALDWER